MPDFNPRDYGPVLAPLLDADRRRELGPGRPDQAARPRLQAVTIEAAFAHTRVTAERMARACLAGLWLLYDFLDESHAISQEIDTTTGSYWHGIMHRREPDYANANYWFRRVGRHPVFEPLAQAASALTNGAIAGLPSGSTRGDNQVEALSSGDWDPFAFVNLCEAIARGRSPYEALARDLARREWELLFAYSYREATGT